MEALALTLLQRLPLPVKDVDGEGPLEVALHHRRRRAVELVDPEDGVVPPARDEDVVLEVIHLSEFGLLPVHFVKIRNQTQSDKAKRTSTELWVLHSLDVHFPVW